MSDFIDQLQTKYKTEIDRTINHPWTVALTNGSLSDASLNTYLVQDQRFFMTSIRMLARTIQLCDNDTAVTALGRQMGFFCQDENTYFDRTLAEMRDSGFTADIPVSPEVEEFLDFLKDLTTSDIYARNITAMYTFELIYLLWAEPYEKKVEHLAYKHKEWVYLHSGPDFTKWTQFLKSEVARVVGPDTKKIIEATMAKVIELEEKFFNATYHE